MTRVRLTRYQARQAAQFLGIAVAALALALAARNGAEREYDRVIASIGSNLLRVMPSSSLPFEEQGFTQGDFDALSALPSILSVHGESSRSRSATAGVTRYALWFLGVTPGYVDALKLPLRSGRGLIETDGALSAVLGSSVAEALFGEADPVGTLFDAGDQGQLFIVGVLESLSPSSSPKPLLNDVILISVDDVLQKRAALPEDSLARSRPLYEQLWVRIDVADSTTAIRGIRSLFGDQANLEAFEEYCDAIFTRPRQVARLYEFTALGLLFICVANVITLGVSSVVERANEIGVRRSIGASRRRVVCNMLGALLPLSIIGSGLGIVVAVLVAPHLQNLFYTPLQFDIRHAVAMLGLVCVVLMAAAIPALKAVRVHPTEMLRRRILRGVRAESLALRILTFAAATVGITAILFAATFRDSLLTIAEEMFPGVDPRIIAVETDGGSEGDPRMPHRLTIEDAEAIRALNEVAAVTCETRLHLRCSGSDRLVRVSGIDHLGALFFPGKLETGRYFTEEELATGANVAMLDPELAARLFPAGSPLGETIQVGEEAYTVVGTFECTPRETPTSDVFIPRVSLAGWTEHHVLWVQISSHANPSVAIDRIQAVLSQRYPDNAAATIVGPAAELSSLVFYLNGMTHGMLGLTLAALALSGAGVLNSFWLEAIRLRFEMGIRRTLGATALRIFWRLQVSTLIVVLASGVVATAIALTGVHLASALLNEPFMFQWIWILWSVLAVLVSAILGGGIPALWAARLVPADTIRTGRQ